MRATSIHLRSGEQKVYRAMLDALKSEPTDEVSRFQLRQMITGYQISRCVYVAAKLGIADLLEDGPKSIGELAIATRTQPTSLERFLRALSSHGVFAVDHHRRVSLTPLGNLLRRGVEHSLWPAAVYWGEQSIWEPWGNLLYSLRTGAPAFDHMHGATFFDFLTRFPDAGHVFDRFIAEGLYSRPTKVIRAYDFSQSNVIADVGGGQGATLAEILKANAKVRGILFDRPHVIESARGRLTEAGVIDRCFLVAGNFFEAVPTGADTYLLSQIIHDWADEPACAILKNCRRVMDGNSKLLLVEQVLDALCPDPATALLDLTMLAILGGKERTEAEYDLLLGQADLKVSRIIPTASPFSIIEAVPFEE